MADRMRAAGESEIRIASLIETDRKFRRIAEARHRRAGSQTNPAAGDAPGRADGAGEAGPCGAPTQDGTPCRNAKGGCPHHRNSNRSGARQQPARARRRRS